MKYKDQLKTNEWADKRREIKERDLFFCEMCKNDCGKLEVHHIKYLDPSIMAWEYPNSYLITLCEDCHDAVHNFIIVYGDYIYENLLKDE